MRLTNEQQDSIRAASPRCFGVSPRRFGSRADGRKKGGDIDLFMLEQRNVIVAQDGPDRRKLRNAPAHEHPNKPDRQAGVLTDAWQATSTLLAWRDRIVARVEQGNQP